MRATEDTEITEWIEKADRYGFLCVLCGITNLHLMRI